MKLKTRLIIAFLTVILIPVILTIALFFLLGFYQLNSIEKNYGLQEARVGNVYNSIETISTATEHDLDTLEQVARREPEKLWDLSYIKAWNQVLEDKRTILVVSKEDTFLFSGKESSWTEEVLDRLPLEEGKMTAKDGVYLGGGTNALVKHIAFLSKKGGQEHLFLVSQVGGLIPEAEAFFVRMAYSMLLVLVLTASSLIFWIHRGVMKPLSKMQLAAKKIKEGDLNFQLKPESEDELGSLCKDLEEMRIRLADTAEERLKFDRENKELISNISHDLKTPVTTIKGYAEGILDGVADTPEKIERYVRTIYNKASEMDLLINELTFYSKIDTNRIPYNFNTISVSRYFEDCVEDLEVEMESRGIEFGYFNYVEEGVKVIADAEQLKRVVHNIINNSLKYMDKEKGKINLRVKDVGDFVQVEIEDNGRGIGTKDLPNIFDRFFRTDASRNSSKGGSGIGLSIVKKIVEEHGGKIWATSKEGMGTTMYFVLRKYQEGPSYE